MIKEKHEQMNLKDYYKNTKMLKKIQNNSNKWSF